MFEDYQEIFSNIDENIREMLSDIPSDINNLADDAIRELLGEALLKGAEIAISKTPELQYEPLKQQLLNNLSNLEQHVILNGDSVQVFNEDYAGTHEDLISGQEAGGSNLTHTDTAARVWKYGIYLARSQSSFLAGKLSLPTYDQVISDRLSAWGDKAPYWWFLEYGNAGLGRAFPTFPGTGFIEAIRSQAPDIVRRAREIFGGEFLTDLDNLAEIAVTTPIRSKTRITIFRYKVGATRISLQKSSAGNYFYRIANKTYSVEQFKDVVRTLMR